MKTLREIFSDTPFMEKRKIVVGSAPSERRKDIFGQEWYNPHEEMAKCRDAYNSNGLISSAVDSLTDFIMGNDLTVQSDDKSTENFFQKIIDDSDPDMFETAREGVEQAIKIGNGYIELDFDTINGKRIPTHFYPVPDGSRIYLNTDPYGYPLQKERLNPVTLQTEKYYDPSEYYILRVPDSFKPTRDMKVKTYILTYSFSTWKEIRIRGIPIHRDKLMHFKWGLSDNGLYGRSFIASILDDHDILKRIEKALGIIAKYKAVPKKLIGPKEGEELSPDDADELAMYFQGLEDDENAIVSKRLDAQDLSYAGKDIQMGTSIDHTRKKIVSGLTPEFLIGYGMDVNKATAGQLMIAFMLRLETKRRLWCKQWTKRWIEPYRKVYPQLQKAKVVFGELDFRSPLEKNNEIRARWQTNQITFNEMRKALGESTIGKDGDKFYKDFTIPPQQPSLFGGFGKPVQGAIQPPRPAGTTPRPATAKERFSEAKKKVLVTRRDGVKQHYWMTDKEIEEARAKGQKVEEEPEKSEEGETKPKFRGSKGIDASIYIKSLRQLMKDNPNYAKYYDWVLESGKKFDAIKNEDKKITKELMNKLSFEPKVKECYYTSALALLDIPDLKYYEGWIVREDLPIPIEHAWNEYKGKLVDFTTKLWKGKPNASYFGVEIPKDFVLKQMTKRGVTGPYLSAYFRKSKKEPKIDKKPEKESPSEEKIGVGREKLSEYANSLSGRDVDRMHLSLNKFEEQLKKAIEKGEIRIKDKKKFSDFMSETVKCVIKQTEISYARTLGDHGIRHITSNIDRMNRFFDELRKIGVDVSNKDRVLSTIVMYYHDWGYVSPRNIWGWDLSDHPKESVRMMEKYGYSDAIKEIFGEKEWEKVKFLILNHDSDVIDWKNKPLQSAISLSDNLALFAKSKLPSLFVRIEGSIEILEEIQKYKNNKKKVELLKKELEEKVKEKVRDPILREELMRAANEVTVNTPKFTLGMYAGEIEDIKMDKNGVMNIDIEKSEYEKRLQKLFEMGQRQFKKFVDSYGVSNWNEDSIEIKKNNKTLVKINVVNKRPEYIPKIEKFQSLKKPLKKGTVAEKDTPKMFPINPTGTKTLEKQLAVDIRKIYKKAKKELLEEIETHKESLQKHLLAEGRVSGNIIGKIGEVLSKIDVQVKGLTNNYVKQVADKTHRRVMQFLGQPIYMPQDQQLLKLLKERAFSNVKGLTDEIRKNLVRDVTNGVVQGTSISEVKEIVKNNMNVANARAEKIARNELISAANETTISTSQRAGINRFKWITAWDDRVCSGRAFKKPVLHEGKAYWNCRDLAGKVFKFGPNMPRPIHSTHINCRCSLAPYIEIK